MDFTKMKVPELRAELGKRGLNTFGTRQVLIDRLTEALGTQISEESAKEIPNGVKTNAVPKDNEPLVDMPNDETSNKIVENGEPVSEKPSESEYKRKRSHSRSPRRSRSRDRDNRRSPKRRSRSPQTKSAVSEEPSGWEESSSVFLDKYNSDLSLVIDNDGYTAKPRTDGGFASMWAGVRANYGAVSGKTFFEVKCLKNLSVDNKDSLAGGSTHVVRVGWSSESTGFTLGEEPQSFGYGGTGKKSCNNKFSDYGCSFDEGDVVGAFLEWSASDVVMRFSVNGVDQGECFRVPKSSFGEKRALFPHVYVKNVEFTVNFGQDSQPPWYPPNIPNDDPLSWQLINNLDTSSKVHGRKPPPSKSECEVIMMVGLPGAGKTYYAERLRDENREKQYNVLGTNLILDKMKVLGLGRQRNYHSRWNALIQEATDCLNVLFGVASKRRRNYILDQTNVYPSAQRRKMRPFEGFKRKAIVIVPTDEEFRRRIAQREKEEGKEVPESAVLEMKANFGIPKALSDDPDSVFDEVTFTELGASAAEELVRCYNQEGQSNRLPEKRQRRDGSRDRDDSRSGDSRYRSSYDRDRGKDFGRGRRDDFRRSPNRRDDRGRRDYRGGYNAERDRSRERYDRGRDQDSYGRSPVDRFGGTGGRFGGPRGGGFSGMGPRGGFGAYGAPRGGGGMPMRGGRGGSMNEGMGRGYGFDSGPGAPMDYRGDGPRGGSRGRGGFRPGPGDMGAVPGGYSDPMFTGGAPSRFEESDAPPPSQGGYRGGYGGPPGRGAYGSVTDTGVYNQGSGRMGMPPGRGGRGGPDRDSRGGPGSMSRGGSGYPGRQSGFSSGGYGGAAFQDQDSSSLYSMGPGQRPQSFSTYPPGGLSDNYATNSTGYPTGEEQPDRSRDRFSGPGGPSGYGSQVQQPKPSSGPGGYAGSYQRGGYTASGPPGYQADAFSNPPNPYPPGSYSGPEGYTNSGAGARGDNRSGSRGAVSSQGGSRGFSGGDNKADNQQSESSSLYASGAAARYGEPRSGAAPPSANLRQSRFDSKPSSATSQPYSAYPVGTYQSGYPGTGAYGSDSTGVAVAPPAAATARTGRSRFDTGPTSIPPGAPASQQSQSVSQPQSATTQSYGYGYGAQSAKPDPQSSAPGQQSYYGYGYGGYGGTYGGQTQSSTNQNRSVTTAPSTTPSLYASVVSDKSQQNVTPSTQSNTSSQAASTESSNAPLTAPSYVSYYGYGGSTTLNPNMPTAAQPPSGAVAAAQPYGSWPPQTAPPVAGTPATTTGLQTGQNAAAAAAAAAAAYASYYPSYSAYVGYGAAAPVAGTTAAPPPAPQSMPQQYYGGYR